MIRAIFSFFLCLSFTASVSTAGPYAPAVGESGSTAVSMTDSAIVAWATGYTGLSYGTDVDAQWKTPEKALGPAKGDTLDIVSLGRGGSIILTFAHPIKNGQGWDFAIFENGFNSSYLELAFVEVSSNGSDFVRFDNDSRTPGPVPAALDTTDINGLAGKYQKGYGTPFDLQDLADKPLVNQGTVDITAVTHVKIIDIVGDGTWFDTDGDIIYDVYPTFLSAGFDLEAIAVRFQQNTGNSSPQAPDLIAPPDFDIDTSLVLSLESGTFSDPDTSDFHLATQWQISRLNDFMDSALVLNLILDTHLSSLTVPQFILSPATTYYWRVAYLDSDSNVSDWSDVRQFTTINAAALQTIDTDWDEDGAVDADIPTIASDNSAGEQRLIGIQASTNIASIETLSPVEISETSSVNRPDVLSSGLVGFRVQVTDSNEYAEVTVYFSEAIPAGHVWYKYDSVNGWREYTQATFNAARTHLTLRLKDGSKTDGDIDGIKNGVIIDPGGTGYVSIPAEGEAGIGDPGGCFITTIQPRGINSAIWIILGLLVLLPISILLDTIRGRG